MRKARKKQSETLGIHINESIQSREVRVIDPDEGNLGVMLRDDAIRLAQAKGMDLIEINGDIEPAVTKIMDYGRYQYDLKRKRRDIKAKVKDARVEVKEVQIKPGTSDNDNRVKANRATKWLLGGHRLKVELFLRGRSKYMDKDFLRSRIDHFLSFLLLPYTIVEELTKTPKGLHIIVEMDKKAAKETEKLAQIASMVASIDDEELDEPDEDSDSDDEAQEDEDSK